MPRLYKRRRYSYGTKRRFIRRRRSVYRRRGSKIRRGYIRRRINYRRGMLRNCKLTTQYFIHPSPGVSPLPSTVNHVFTPTSVNGFSSRALDYEYYKLNKVVITYQNPSKDVASNIPGQYLNGLLSYFPDYNGGSVPTIIDEYFNNSNCKTRYLDGRNSSFTIKCYPKYQGQIQGSGLTDANIFPRKTDWVSTNSPGGSVTWRGIVAGWFGAVQLGLPTGLANTGYLLYRYTYYFSFRQRKTTFLM